MAKVALQPTVAKEPVESTSTGTVNVWDKTTPPEAKRKILQTIDFHLSNFDDDKRTFQAIASTPIRDRQGDTIDQTKWELDNFKKNPVIPWAHDYAQPPVARAIEIGVDNGMLIFTYQAPPKGMYEFADTIWDFYRNQYLFSFSVGFRPTEDPDGDWMEGYAFGACELLEISAVVVPANPQALALAYKMGDISERQAKSLISRMSVSIKNLEDTINKEKEGTVITAEAIESAASKAVEKEMEAKGAISSNLSLAPKDTAWDKGAAIKAIKDWASDGDGNIDWSKYRKCFMWVDGSGGDKQGDYKLPFADIIGGEPKAVWNAVKAIYGVLEGARGGVDIPEADKAKVLAQVKKYYKKFGEGTPGGDDGKSLTADKENSDTENMADVEKTKDEKVEKSEEVVEAKEAEATEVKETTETKDAEVKETKSEETKDEVETKEAEEVEEKDMSEAGSGSALTPREMARVKAAHDYMKDMQGTMLDHAKALEDHSTTMSAHSALVKQMVSNMDTHMKALEDLLDHDGDETTGGGEEEDAMKPDDGISGKSEDSLSAKPSDIKAKAEDGEVKSEEEVPTDGADHEDEETEEVQKSVATISDESEVDPDNLTDAEAEFITKRVNEILIKEAKTNG